MNLPRRANKIHKMSQAIAVERLRVFKLGEDARAYATQAIAVVAGGALYYKFEWWGVFLVAGYYGLTAVVALVQYKRSRKEGV